MVILRVLAMQPGGVGVALALRGVFVELLAVEMHIIAEVFVPRRAVKLADPEGAVALLPHDLRQVGPAPVLDSLWLPMGRFGVTVAKDTRGGRLAARAHRVAGGNADRASGVGLRKRYAAMHKAIEIRRVDMGIAERRDGVEALLVGHDKENIGFFWHVGFSQTMDWESWVRDSRPQFQRTS